MYTVYGTIDVHPSDVPALQIAAYQLKDEIDLSGDCTFYTMLEDVNHLGGTMIVQRWKNLQALRSHLVSSAFERFRRSVEKLRWSSIDFVMFETRTGTHLLSIDRGGGGAADQSHEPPASWPATDRCS